MSEILLYYGNTTIELLTAFIVVLIFIKIFGMNYQMRQMTVFDLIINFILGAVLGGFITNEQLSLSSFIGIMSIYIIIVYLTNLVIKKTEWGRRTFVGSPKTIIFDGKIDEKMMSRLNLSVHELASALRAQKIKSLTEVKMAQVEPGGDLTVVRKGDLTYSVILIDNGLLDKDALVEIGRTEKWLYRQLRAKGITDIEDVFAAQWHKNRLYIIKKS